ncbi:MAG: Ty1/Copia family ribonuclease HI, partial [Candidatus Phytoplasma australasiaticum]|nr:Ty1/Copia family ribonuclease HI [Candidatus Phytoplasma australasiaticum]
GCYTLDNISAKFSFYFQHPRTKHIDINIKYHFLREQVNDKIAELVHCSTDENLADIFTKPLKPNMFQKMKKKFGMENRV